MGSEQPRPGMLFAIDAEFVALSPPETTFEFGVEVQTRPARLGLGRVSVLRGEGPRAGACCVDDYVRCVEPVYDYLTRFSGLVPGDLDPSVGAGGCVVWCGEGRVCVVGWLVGLGLGWGWGWGCLAAGDQDPAGARPGLHP
jgi:hypothetical protein